jgi:hypothetical protein
MSLGSGRGELGVELHGQLAAITNLGDANKRGTNVMPLVVAEEGLEPPTHGL